MARLRYLLVPLFILLAFLCLEARAEERGKPLADVKVEHLDTFFHFWVWQEEPLESSVVVVLDYELLPGQVGTYSYRLEIEEVEEGRYRVEVVKKVHCHLEDAERFADAEIMLNGVRPVIDDMYRQLMLYPPRNEEERIVKRIVGVLYDAGIVLRYICPS